MKTISAQYHEILSQSRRCKPRSQRKIVLTKRLKELMTRQLRKELVHRTTAQASTPIGHPTAGNVA